MGYTHYAYRAQIFDGARYDKFITDFKTVLPFFAKYLSIDKTDNQCLEVTDQKLWFNGIGEESHETFAFRRVEDKDSSTGYGRENTNTPYFMFCKTAQKDYDIAACCALIIAKKHFEDDIVVSSDGDISDWKEAIELCEDELEYGEKFIFPPYIDGVDGNGGYFNDCVECDGEGCLDCQKPCEPNCHTIEDNLKTFSHSTGEGEWAVCETCGYGVQMIWHTEYVGEKITKADDMDDILEELR